MAYSVVGILALFIHIIVNFDVLFRKGGRSFPGGKQYLCFLIGVLLFHAADGCWGLLYDNKLAKYWNKPYSSKSMDIKVIEKNKTNIFIGLIFVSAVNCLNTSVTGANRKIKITAAPTKAITQ